MANMDDREKAPQTSPQDKSSARNRENLLFHIDNQRGQHI